MLTSETWIMLRAGAACAIVAVVVAVIIKDRGGEPEDVTIGFLGPSLAAIYLLVLAVATPHTITPSPAIAPPQAIAPPGAIAPPQPSLARPGGGTPTAPAAHTPAQTPAASVASRVPCPGGEAGHAARRAAFSRRPARRAGHGGHHPVRRLRGNPFRQRRPWPTWEIGVNEAYSREASIR